MPISTIGTNGLTTPLPASNLGTPSAINLSNATALARAALPTGSVLQTVYATTNNIINTNSTTYQDSGSTATITPTSATSKILILTMAPGTGKNASADYAKLQLQRSGTAISTMPRFGLTDTTSPANFQTCNFIVLDSPATNSAVTYKIQFAAGTTAGSCYFNVDGQLCTMILMEIAA